jgi:peptidyl-prolyl cis-trans isomerase SurA
MRHTTIVNTALFLSALALPVSASAQTPTQTQTQTPATATQGQKPAGDKVASIIAVVGDSAITSAYLIDATQRRMAELQQAKRPVPDPASPEMKSLQDQLISERVDELVILQTIAHDTTYKVNEETLNAAVEDRYNKVQTDQGGPVAFAQALRANGFTSTEYRALLAGQIRTEELFRQFKQRQSEKRQAPKATEKEIVAFFPQWQAAHGAKPAMVSYQQIVVRVEPSDTALARAKAKADSIFQVVIKNRDAFPDLARRFSDDAGTKDKGGEFGWFSENEVAKAFGKAAFAAPVNTVIPPVRSEFGYHVIEVERRRAGQVQARHILITPTVTQADVDRARARADSAAAALRAGGNLQDIIHKYGDPTEDQTVSGFDPAQVLSVKGLDLTKAAKGDIVGPAASPAGPAQFFTVARVTDISPAGQWSIDDVGVRDNIRSIVEGQKLLDEVVSELKRNTYVEIRPH